MNNPQDTSQMKYYLRFNDVDNADWIRIGEPEEMDGLRIALKQDNNINLGRDINFSLDYAVFTDARFEKINNLQILSPYGRESYYLEHCLEWFFYVLDLKGFEADVDFKMMLGSVEVVYSLDFDGDFTDGKTYVKAKLDDTGKKSKFKARFEEKVNLFSDKDIDGQTITPLGTFNYLRKGTQTELTSKWKLPNTIISPAGSANAYNNFSQQIVQSDLRRTLTYFDPTTTDFTTAKQVFKFIRFRNDVENVRVKFENDTKISYRVTGGDSTSKVFMKLFYVNYIDPLAMPAAVEVYSKEVTGATNQTVAIDNVIEFTLQSAQRDSYLTIFWQLYWETEHLDNGNRTSFDFYKQDISITAIDKPIDVVIKATRQIDVYKQLSEYNQNISVNAPKLDVGGIHYDNVVFNKRMITGNLDQFNITAKDAYEGLLEYNNHNEISNDEIFIGDYSDFYQNNEIGVFVEIPSEDYTEAFNPKYMLNRIDFGYKNYEQDRDTDGTSGSIHTETQLSLRNEKAVNTRSYKFFYTRDPLAIQKAVDLEFEKPTTSTQDNDVVYIEKIRPVAPGTIGGFSANLAMQVNSSGRVKILNINSESSDEDRLFFWTSLGLSIGAQFSIVSGVNVGNYSVYEILTNKITLTPIGFTPTYTGDAYIYLQYTYNNVLYKTETTEGWAETVNLTAGFANKFYSLKRNILNYFGQILSTALIYCKKDILEQVFKNNGDAGTRLTTETDLIVEKAQIDYADLPTPLVTGKLIKIKVSGTFEQVINFVENYKQQRGFIRFIKAFGGVAKGYIVDYAHTVASNEVVFTVEEKYETQVLILVINESEISVNGVIYVKNDNWYKFENGYLTVYDENNLPIINRIIYNLVNLNGVIYNSKEELQFALSGLE